MFGTFVLSLRPMILNTELRGYVAKYRSKNQFGGYKELFIIL